MGVPHRIRSFRPSAAMVAAAAALAIAAAGGWWLGGATRDEAPATAGDTVVTVGALQLGLEPTWVSADSVPGLPVAGAAVLAPAPGLTERALLVTGAAADASLIPAALRAELPADLPEPRRAVLAGLPAWTYGPLGDESRMLEITVAPTTAGVLALACSAPATTWSAWLDCGNGVQSASGAEALTPTPDLAFRQAAAPVLQTLDGERVSERARLSARRPAAAVALARAHREAASALAPFTVAGAPAAAVSAMRDAARGYDALAASARSRDRSRFVAARARVSASDAALAAALADLRQAAKRGRA
jgi:hypothetical protein